MSKPSTPNVVDTTKSKKLDIFFLFCLSILLALGIGAWVGQSFTGTTNTFAPGSIETTDVNFTGDWYRGSTNLTGRLLGDYGSTDIDTTGMITGADLNFTSDFYWNSLNRTDTLAYPEQAASYIIFNSSNVIYAKNGITGQIDYSGTNATTVINNALISCPINGLVYIKGEIEIDSPIEFVTRKNLYFDKIINAGAGYAFDNPTKGTTAVHNFKIAGSRLLMKAGSGGSGVDLLDCYQVTLDIHQIEGDNKAGGSIGVHGERTVGQAGFWNFVKINNILLFDENISLGAGANAYILDISRNRDAGTYGVNIDGGFSIYGRLGDLDVSAGTAMLRLNDCSDIRLIVRIEAASLSGGAFGVQITASAEDYHLFLSVFAIGAGTIFDLNSYDGHIFYRDQIYGQQKILTFSVPLAAGDASVTKHTIMNDLFRDIGDARVISFSGWLDAVPGAGETVNITLTGAPGSMTLSYGAADQQLKNTTAFSYSADTQYLTVKTTCSGGSASTRATVTVVYQLLPPGTA